MAEQGGKGRGRDSRLGIRVSIKVEMMGEWARDLIVRVSTSYFCS